MIIESAPGQLRPAIDRRGCEGCASALARGGAKRGGWRGKGLDANSTRPRAAGPISFPLACCPQRDVRDAYVCVAPSMSTVSPTGRRSHVCSVLCVRVSEGRLAFLTLVCLLHSQACFFQGRAGTASAEASAAKQPGLGGGGGARVARPLGRAARVARPLGRGELRA